MIGLSPILLVVALASQPCVCPTKTSTQADSPKVQKLKSVIEDLKLERDFWRKTADGLFEESRIYLMRAEAAMKHLQTCKEAAQSAKLKK